MLGVEVFDYLQTLLLAVIGYQPALAEKFVECLPFNPLLWQGIDDEIQCARVRTLNSFVEHSPETVRPQHVVDCLFNAIQGYVSLDPAKYGEVIHTLWTVARSLARENLSYKVIKTILGYANWNYLKNLPNYPLLIWYALRTLLELFVEGKSTFVEVIKKDIRVRRDSMTLTTLFAALIYITDYLELSSYEVEKGSPSKRSVNSHGEVIVEYYARSKHVIDQILAVCIYMVLEFEWNSFSDLAKDMLKEKITKGGIDSGMKVEDSLVTFLMRQLIKTKKLNELHILNSVFSRAKSFKLLGKASAKAFIAALLNRPEDLLVELQLRGEAPSRVKDEAIVIKSMDLLTFIIEQAISVFDKEAKDELVTFLMTEQQLITKIVASKVLIHPFLKLSLEIENEQLSAIQAGMLNAFTPCYKSHLWKSLAGSFDYKLRVVDHWIGLVFDQYYASGSINEKIAINCLEISYFLENLLENSKVSQNFVRVLSKLVLLLKKTRSLYITVPSLRVVDDRTVQTHGYHQYREGGTLRVIFKAVLLAMKAAKSEESFNLLKCLLYSDKQTKEAIRKFAQVKKVKGKKTEKLSLLKLMLREEKAVAFSNACNEYYANVINNKGGSILSKSITIEKGNKDFFKNSYCLLLFVISSIIQLLYFDIFKMESHKSFPMEKDLLAKIQASSIKSENCVRLVEVLKELFACDSGKVMKVLVEGFGEYRKLLKSRLVASCVGCVAPEIRNAYSMLDSAKSQSEDIEFVLLMSKESKEEFWTKTLKNFEQNWIPFIKVLADVLVAEKDSATAASKAADHILDANVYFALYPSLLFLTNNSLFAVDVHISSKASFEDSPSIECIAYSIPGFINKVWMQAVNIPVRKVKFARDELRSEFIGEMRYRKTFKEQYSELGCWYDKGKDKRTQLLFDYVEKQYGKLVRRRKEREHKRVFGRFVETSLKRDKMGRSMRLKRLRKVEELYYGYEYLRLFVLKKMLVKALCGVGDYSADLKFEMVRNLFKRREADQSRRRFASTDRNSVESCEMRSGSSVSGEIMAVEGQARRASTFDAELITIKGCTFGKLIVTSSAISFRSTENSSANTVQHASDIRLFKEWQLEHVTEILIKRYHFIRKCIEIYFVNSRPVLFSLLSKVQLKSFLMRLRNVVGKRSGLKLSVVQNPEKYFAAAKFAEAWSKNEVSNFDYLMLLNKYSGRTFNDLSQYPIFPWIIKDYKKNTLDLFSKDVYRPLDRTMAEIAERRRRTADAQANESFFQFKTHYLPYKAVCSYLSHLEPYTSLLSPSELSLSPDAASARPLLGDRYECSENELVPEFFYSPEFLRNHNMAFFGTEASHGAVTLPPWANNYHEFIQGNVMGLESAYVSSSLDQWIELIFGTKQQEPKHYNSLKAANGEQGATPAQTEDHYMEMQKLGVNPMCIFAYKHPSRSEKNMRNAAQYSIFNWYHDKLLSENKDTKSTRGDRLFVLLKLSELAEGQPIVFVESPASCVMAITNTRKMYLSKKVAINQSSTKSIFFKKELEVTPFKPFYDEVGKVYRECDSQRCFAVLDDHLVTCRHYDNSWKVASCKSGEVIASLLFHNHVVNCICVAKTKVFTASSDGVVAMWLINRKSVSFPPLNYPVWSRCSYSQRLTSIDACEKLGLVATSSSSTVILRRTSDGKLAQVVRLGDKERLLISHVRLSCRGYVLVVAKSGKSATDARDRLFVYSVNGQLVSRKLAPDSVTSVVLSESGYEFVVGGRAGRVVKYELLTLEARDLLESVDREHPQTRLVMDELPKLKFSVTTLHLTLQEGHQNLLIGTSTGSLYTLRLSSK